MASDDSQVDASPLLITGAAGFLGRYVLPVLREHGRQVVVVDCRPVPDVEFHHCDLANGPPELTRRPDEVYHLAGRAHRTPRTRAEAEAFDRVNVEGTRHLLQGLDRLDRPPRAFVFASTVAVYGRTEGVQLDESTPRRATDPYGASKVQAEDLVREWGARHGVRVGVVRLPLVAGADAPGNLGAMVRFLRRGRYFGVGDGSARRSVVLARDVARILPEVARHGGTFHLTDGTDPTFRELERAFSAVLGRRPPRRLPLWLARTLAWIGDGLDRWTPVRAPLTRARLLRMTSTLTFDDREARRTLGWNPGSVLEHAREIVAFGEESDPYTGGSR